jgi:MarR family 2-MHQ and catechol resistance regulon transcriptional repressor
MGTHHRGTPAEVRALDAYIKLRRASNTVLGRLDPSFRAAGLSENQLGVLEALFHLGPLHQAELGRKLLVSRANVTLLVDHLVGRGLVRRERQSDDRRRVRVTLTAEGRRLVRRVFAGHVAAIVAAMGPLTAAEQQELGRLCRKLGRGER